MKANPLAAAALITALVVTSSAYAEEVLVTYMGIIQSGIDYAVFSELRGPVLRVTPLSFST